MGSFIESLFDITNDANDRLYKEHFVKLYNEKYNLRKDWSSLITDVKKAGLVFKPGDRVMYEGKSERGVIVGIKLRLVEDECEEDNVINKLYPALQKIDNEKENEIIKLKQKIIELEQHIFDLMQVENITIEKEQFIDVEDLVNVEAVKPKRKYTKKEKNIKIDIVEKNIEIKPDKIDLDIVFLDSELSAFF
jgi:hypothetical protein